MSGLFAISLGIALYDLVSSMWQGLENIQAFSISLLVILYCRRIFYAEYKQDRLFSPINFYSVLIILHFGLPGCLLVMGVIEFEYMPNFPFLAQALGFVLLCFIMLQLGVALACRINDKNKLKNKPNKKHYVWGSGRVVGFLMILIITGWIARVYWILSGGYFQIDRQIEEGVAVNTVFYGPLRLAEYFPLYTYIIAMVVGYHNSKTLDAIALRFPKFWKWLIINVGVGEFIYWAFSGRKQEIILVLIMPVIIRYLYICRLPSKSVLTVGVLSILIIFPVTHYYRYSLDVNSGFKSSLSDIPAVINAITELDDSLMSPFEVVANRLNLTESVAASIRIINTDVWSARLGEDYVDIITMQIPRFIWNDKPYFHYGTLFGHVSGMLASNNLLTSISVTYFGEAYLNFMWLGSLIFIVFGFVFEYIYIKASGRDDPKWMLLYLLFIVPMIYVGGTVAMYFGGIIRPLILFYLIGLLLASGYRRYTPNANVNVSRKQ